eukprot:IDg5360t1
MARPPESPHIDARREVGKAREQLEIPDRELTGSRDENEDDDRRENVYAGPSSRTTKDSRENSEGDNSGNERRVETMDPRRILAQRSDQGAKRKLSLETAYTKVVNTTKLRKMTQDNRIMTGPNSDRPSSDSEVDEDLDDPQDQTSATNSFISIVVNSSALDILPCPKCRKSGSLKKNGKTDKSRKEKLESLENSELAPKQKRIMQPHRKGLAAVAPVANELIRPGTLDMEASYELIRSLQKQTNRQKTRYQTLERSKSRAEVEATFFRTAAKESETKIRRMVNENKARIQEKESKIDELRHSEKALAARVRMLEEENANLRRKAQKVREPSPHVTRREELPTGEDERVRYRNPGQRGREKQGESSSIATKRRTLDEQPEKQGNSPQRTPWGTSGDRKNGRFNARDSKKPLDAGKPGDTTNNPQTSASWVEVVRGRRKGLEALSEELRINATGERAP